MCVLYVTIFEAQIARIFRRVWSEQVKVVLSGFSVRLLWYVHAKTLCSMVVCVYLLHSCLCV